MDCCTLSFGRSCANPLVLLLVRVCGFFWTPISSRRTKPSLSAPQASRDAKMSLPPASLTSGATTIDRAKARRANATRAQSHTLTHTGSGGAAGTIASHSMSVTVLWSRHGHAQRPRVSKRPQTSNDCGSVLLHSMTLSGLYHPFMSNVVRESCF